MKDDRHRAIRDIDEGLQYQIETNEKLIRFGWAFFFAVWYKKEIHGELMAISEIPQIMWDYVFDEMIITHGDSINEIVINWNALIEYRNHFLEIDREEQNHG